MKARQELKRFEEWTQVGINQSFLYAKRTQFNANKNIAKPRA